MPDEIPLGVTIAREEGEIPSSVVEFSEETEAPELRPYVISFEKYNHKLCEISDLGKNKGKKALGLLKQIGTEIYCRADFQRKQIRSDGVERLGAYKVLYNGIAEGVEVRELFLQGNARIFYFDIEPERTLYIVAIKENHFEIGKTRRG